MKLKGFELKLGDVVQVATIPFGSAIVKEITHETVTFFRPYAITSDFSYGDKKVICYIGLEEFTASRGQSEWEVVQRGNVTK